MADQNLELASHFPQQNRKNKVKVTMITNTTNQNPQQQIPTMNNNNNNYSSSSSSSQHQQYLRDFETPQETFSAQNLSLSLSFHQYATNLNLKNALLVSNSVPLGPFTGYTSILKRSRFLNPTKQILDEFCGVKPQNVDLGLYDFSGGMRENSFGRVENRLKNSKLGLLLDEVYKRYKLYYQQMQSVVASFETVPGLGNAAPYISFAVKTIGKHFICLKNAILDQIQILGDGSSFSAANRGDPNPRLCSIEQAGPHLKSGQNISFIQHPVWRSQRGLPDNAVTQLKKWLFEHFLHPYPSDAEKLMLAQQTGLSRTQVSNWFINARVRVWKPMVEEIHTLETRQVQTQSEANNLPSSNNLTSENTVDATFRQIQTKRPRNEIVQTREDHSEEHRNACFNFLAGNHHQMGNNNFSLALGLQGNGIRFLQPFNMNTAQHSNIQTDSEVDLTARLEARNQNFR
ncbi:hypothetical protein ACFE04_031197 [Oxalis oulophora]